MIFMGEKKNNLLGIIWILFQIGLVLLFISRCFGEQKVLYIDGASEEIRWDQEITENRQHICASGISLKSGSYGVRVFFDIDESQSDCAGMDGYIEFTELDYPTGLHADRIHFLYGYSEVDSDINIQTFYNSHDVCVDCSIPGNYTISKILITENVIYRYTRLFVLIVLLTLINGYIIVYRKCVGEDSKKHYLYYVFGGTVICILASLPAFCGNKVFGHDFIFHISRIISMSDELRAGSFPVRVYQSANNGYGYASPLCYCDFFLTLPAILYLLKLPILTCYNVYVILINIITVFCAVLLFIQIFGKERIMYVLFGTVLYSLSIYRIMDIYTRDAVGEYTAMAFFPLVCAGMIRIYKKEICTVKDSFMLAIGMSGVVLSHVLSTELVCIALVICVLFNFKSTVRKDRILCLIYAVLICFGLCAWFIIPFVDSYSMNLMAFNDHDMRIQSQGTYLSQVFSIYNHVQGISNGLRTVSDAPFSIGGALTIGLIISVFVLLFVYSNKGTHNKIMKQCLIMTGIYIYASTVFFPWDILVKISKSLKLLLVIQFPWRYLSLAVMTGSIAVAIALEELCGELKANGKEIYFLGALLLEVMLTFSGLGYYYYDYAYNNEDNRDYERQYPDNRICVSEYILNDKEYELSWEEVCDVEREYMSQKHYIPDDSVDLISIDDKNRIYEVINTSDKEQKLTLPILNYDNYHILDINSKNELRNVGKEQKQNLIMVAIPAGYSGKLQIIYRVPILWRISEGVSVVTMAGMILFLILSKKEKIND